MRNIINNTVVDCHATIDYCCLTIIYYEVIIIVHRRLLKCWTVRKCAFGSEFNRQFKSTNSAILVLTIYDVIMQCL